jgi:hypothetical protein
VPLEGGGIRHPGDETVDGRLVERLVHQDVGAPGELDQIVGGRGVARDDDGTVVSVEAIGEGGNDG